MNAWWTVSEWVEALERREVSAEEAVRWVLHRIEAVDPDLNAFVRVDQRGALEKARDIDRRRRAKEPLGPLAGVPVAVKDNIVTRGVETNCASRILQGFVPPYDATVVRRLKAADAVIVGKTNLDEFAMGSANEYSIHGPVRNPWFTLRVAGGSSGGSAAAVAAGLVPAALGSDTGGSVRQPAAMTGTVGLKPTYGRVSRHGLIAHASSLDQVGCITRTTADAARMLAVMAGHDPCDSTSAAVPVDDYFHHMPGTVEGLRIGVPREYLVEGMDPEVEAAVRAAVDHLAGLGAFIEPVSLPHTSYAVAAYYLIATAEASSNLARYDGIRFGTRPGDGEGEDLDRLIRRTRSEGFGREVKRRIMLGTFALSAGYSEAFYGKASRVRHLIREDFLKAFAGVDVIVTPTSPVPAFGLGERLDNPLRMYLLDVFTVPSSLAGLPGLSIPCGFTREELPIGLQILAPPFREDLLFRVGRVYEETTDFHLRRPPQPWATGFEATGERPEVGA